MAEIKDFIEVTALCDGRKASIRTDCIDAVLDNAEYTDDNCRRNPACRTIMFHGETLVVTESYDEIMDMIWKSEL